MAYEVVVRSLSEALPELSAARWAMFPGLAPTDRALMLAHAACIDPTPVVASVWDPARDRLCGLATGCFFEKGGQRVFSVSRFFDVGKAVHVTPGEDRVAISTLLLEALAAHAAREGARKIVLVPFEPEEADLVEAGRKLGYRFIPTQSYQLEAPFDSDRVERYLASISRRARSKFRGDLGRMQRNATVELDPSPSPELLDACFVMYKDTLQRNGNTLKYKRNVLAEMVRAIPKDDLSFVRCESNGQLLGFGLGVRDGTRLHPLNCGHVAEAPFHVHSSLVSTWLKIELDRDARTIFLSQDADVYKQRIGAVAIEYPMGFRSLR